MTKITLRGDRAADVVNRTQRAGARADDIHKTARASARADDINKTRRQGGRTIASTDALELLGGGWLDALETGEAFEVS